MPYQGTIIGHRGASKYCPENTLASFTKAKELGCNIIEFDVMLSKDGIPFIFHDETLNRTTNGKGKLINQSSEELLQLDAGRWFKKKFSGIKIPTLEETLKWLIDNDINANIEIKPATGQQEATVAAVLNILNRVWPESKKLPLLSSFEIDIIRLCRNFAPEIPLALVFDTLPDNWRKLANEINCYSIHLNHKKITQAHIQEIKESDILIFAYTVNSKRKAKKLFSMGVDAIFSDKPDLLK